MNLTRRHSGTEVASGWDFLFGPDRKSSRIPKCWRSGYENLEKTPNGKSRNLGDRDMDLKIRRKFLSLRIFIPGFEIFKSRDFSPQNTGFFLNFQISAESPGFGIFLSFGYHRFKIFRISFLSQPKW